MKYTALNRSSNSLLNYLLFTESIYVIDKKNDN